MMIAVGIVINEPFSTGRYSHGGQLEVGYFDQAHPIFQPSRDALPLSAQRGIFMTPEQALVTSTVNSWKTAIERADKFFLPLTEAQLQKEVAPGKNRLIYLWGHLTAVHDRMLPLLDFGPRLYPELDAPFLTNPDRVTPDLPTGDEIKKSWNEVNGKLLAGFERLSPAEWLQKHTSVSEEDFAKDPSRNRFAILLSRTGHIAFHLGQTALIPK
jgi:hypothetical protein